jgi:transposase
VVHSDALDRRKTKKLANVMEQDCAELTKLKTEQEKISYACEPDAQAAISRLPRGKFHRLVAEVGEKIRYARGKPKGDGTRKIAAITYHLCIEVSRDESAIARAKHKAGCFVLLSNALSEGPNATSSRDLLFTYKDQGYVERNFGFLKDTVIVNSLFLKSPERIEALGLILVLSLLVWRLMERTMRLSLKETGSTIMGWDKRQTSRPTSFMMTTYFPSAPVIQTTEGRMLGKPLKPVQLSYLNILGLSPTIFVDPRAGFVPTANPLTIPGPSG